MQRSRKAIVALSGALLLAAPAHAMPDSVEELAAIVRSEFGGNANAYVSQENGDFRRIGCRGRADLMQQLLDSGLDLDTVDPDNRTDMFVCAIYEKEAAFLQAFLTPKWLAEVDDKYVGRRPISPLMFAVNANDYDLTAALLANDPGYYFWRGGGNENITREGQLLLGAYRARRQKKPRALQAFVEALPADLIADSRDDAFIDRLEDAAKGRGAAESSGGGDGGGGGGLFRAVLGGVAGAAIGGTTGAALGFLGAGTSDSGEGEPDGARGTGAASADTSAQYSSPEQKRLATYLYNVPYSADERVARASLGAQVSPASGPRRGLLVREVRTDGPAAKAGIRGGDVIVSIEGVRTEHKVALYDALEEAGRTDEFEVTFQRGAQTTSVVLPTEIVPASGATASQIAPAPQSQAGPASTGAASGTNATAKSTTSTIEELERLADLRDRGILSEEEFEAMKERILEGT